MMRRGSPADAVAAAVTASILLIQFPAAAVDAHLVGGGRYPSEGTFTLSPAGSLNDSFHVALSEFGLSLETDEILHFGWNVLNASGVAITFEIHTHPSGASLVYYNFTGNAVRGNFTAPMKDVYMLLWHNPTNRTLRVSYTLGWELKSGYQDAPIQEYLIILVIGVAAVAGLAYARREWIRSRQRREGRSTRVRRRPPRDTSDE